MNYFLETERMRFREMHPDDAEAMFLLNSDPEVVQYTGDGPFVSVEAAREFLENYVSTYKRYNCGRWVVELKSTQAVTILCFSLALVSVSPTCAYSGSVKLPIGAGSSISFIVEPRTALVAATKPS